MWKVGGADKKQKCPPGDTPVTEQLPKTYINWVARNFRACSVRRMLASSWDLDKKGVFHLKKEARRIQKRT